jgi:SAM-dependent methyltransferase
MDLHRLMECRSTDELRGRHRIARELVAPDPTDVALEVGCASGYWPNLYLAGRVAKAVGVDLDREEIERAVEFARRTLAPDKQPSFGVSSAHDLPFADAAFTLVYLMDAGARGPSRPHGGGGSAVLAPGGRLVVSVPGDWLFNWLDPITSTDITHLPS